jgi:hypothetical protein
MNLEWAKTFHALDHTATVIRTYEYNFEKDIFVLYKICL